MIQPPRHQDTKKWTLFLKILVSLCLGGGFWQIFWFTPCLPPLAAGFSPFTGNTFAVGNLGD
jgi:hypothetical protein